MTIKSRIIIVLLRVYPASWRHEYGAELTDLLVSEPFNIRIVGDVLCSGLRQRVRTAGLSTALGLVMMAAILGGTVFGWTTVLQDSSMTLPRVIVKPFRSELYVLALIICGCWTQLRHRGNESRPGMAALWVSVLGGIPIVVSGILMLFGILNIPPVGSALHILLAPLFALPQSWIWGTLGGGLGRWISPYVRRPRTLS